MILYYILVPLAWLVFHIGFRVSLGITAVSAVLDHLEAILLSSAGA